MKQDAWFYTSTGTAVDSSSMEKSAGSDYGMVKVFSERRMHI